MAEASVPPEASVASTGKGIRYIGNWAYGYSGVQPAITSGTGTDFLSFTSGSGIIVATIQCYNTVTESEIINWEIVLNGEIVIEYHQEGRASIPINSQEGNAVIIPPITFVIVRGRTVGAETSGAAVLNGRVYGAE
jgi:hypothetical protein